jgi:glycosyltransferase involved in cell wall biosynthesis
MRVILDASEVYERWGSSYRYFHAILPRLEKFPDLHVDLIPSPIGALSPPAGELSAAPKSPPKGSWTRWIPRGKLRSWLGKQKKDLARRSYLKRTATGEPTLYHSYYYTLPPDRRLPMVMVYLDLIPELFRHELDAKYFDDLIVLKERCVRRSERILAISQKTKSDLCAHYDFAADKVDVVYFGIEADFYARPHTEAEAKAFREKHALPERYLLYVGARPHHKNFSRWAQAYAKFPGRKDYAFVAAGPAWAPDEVALLKKLGIRATLIPTADDPTLRLLYRLSDLFVYPSLYEGMGLPPLEAMASGTPVAAARAGAIPEVSGDAAEYFDPRDIDDMIRAVERGLETKRRDELIRLGRAQVGKFTWESAAERTVAAYRKVLV